MQKWEYETLSLIWASADWVWDDNIRASEKTVRDRLDRFGREGWELVGVLSVTGEKGQTKEFQYYFKRPKE